MNNKPSYINNLLIILLLASINILLTSFTAKASVIKSMQKVPQNALTFANTKPLNYSIKPATQKALAANYFYQYISPLHGALPINETKQKIKNAKQRSLNKYLVNPRWTVFSGSMLDGITGMNILLVHLLLSNSTNAS